MIASPGRIGLIARAAFVLVLFEHVIEQFGVTAMCSDRIGLQSGTLAGAAEPSAICPA